MLKSIPIAKLGALLICAMLSCFPRISAADAFPPIELSPRQIEALLGQTEYQEGGFSLRIDEFKVRFLDRAQISLPGLRPRTVVPLAFDQNLSIVDAVGALRRQIGSSWAQMASTCNDRHEFLGHSVKITSISPRQIVVEFSAHYAKYFCWSMHVPQCTINWNFQKCEMGLVSGNTMIFEKTIDYRMELDLRVTSQGLQFVPSVRATNTEDLETVINILNFLDPILKYTVGTLFSPVAGVALAVSDIRIIPKLESPNQIISRIGVPSRSISLDRIKREQLGRVGRLGNAGEGGIDMKPWLQAMVLSDANFSAGPTGLSLRLLSSTPTENSPPESMAAPMRQFLEQFIAAEERYLVSVRNPITTHEVRPGDNLWRVAQEIYGNPYLHLAILESNPALRSREAVRLRAGQQLTLVPYHQLVDQLAERVGNGNSRWSIAERELGAGQEYPRVDVVGSDCRRPSLVYPAQAWRISPGRACRQS